MDYKDLSELREAANGYLFLLQRHEFGSTNDRETSRELVTMLE